MPSERLLDEVLAWFDRFCRDPDDLVRGATYDLAGRELTRAQVEQVFGAYGSWTPGLPHVRDAVLEYPVETLDVPYACTLYATFDVDDVPFGVPEEGQAVLELGAKRVRVFAPGEAHPGMDVLPDRLRSWAERVCGVPAGSPEQTLAALGIEGTLRPEYGAFVVEPPPPGVAELRLDLRQAFPVKRDDLLSNVDVALLDSTVTRADLDARFGRNRWRPRMHPGDDHVLGYSVELAGAPHACGLSAHFREEPTAASVVHRVTMHRQKAPEILWTDEGELAGLVDRFFRVVSFEAGAAPAYQWLHELFIEDGRLIRNSGDTPEVSTVEQFVADRQRQFDAGELTSFREMEIAARTEVFGNIGHRLSTYHKRGVRDGVAFETRGVISTQFVWTPAGWRMSAMAWDDERPGLAIPSAAAMASASALAIDRPPSVP